MDKIILVKATEQINCGDICEVIIGEKSIVRLARFKEESKVECEHMYGPEIVSGIGDELVDTGRSKCIKCGKPEEVMQIDQIKWNVYKASRTSIILKNKLNQVIEVVNKILSDKK